MSTDYIPPADIENLEGMESLNTYTFGDHDVNHYFCRQCGVYPFHDAVQNPGHYRFNLGCIDDIDPFSLEIGLINGKLF